MELKKHFLFFLAFKTEIFYNIIRCYTFTVNFDKFNWSIKVLLLYLKQKSDLPQFFEK